MSSLDGENVWRDFKNRLSADVREDFFRFNLFLNGKEPAIDDIGSMETLQKDVRRQLSDAKSDETCRDVCLALLTSCFYFELDSQPRYDSGGYECSGRIRCRTDCRATIAALTRLMDGAIDFVIKYDVLGILNLQSDRCSGCGRFCKRISFRVRHPSDTIAISMRFEYSTLRKLSGFPQSMEWFAKQQRLDHAFGLLPVDGAGRVCNVCAPQDQVDGLILRKRKASYADYRSASKKRRRSSAESIYY